MILDDRKVRVREIIWAIGISHGTVIIILDEKLALKKLSARWVPHSLTVEDKRNHVTYSMTGLALFRRNLSELWRRLITVDETWIHLYTPKKGEQSKHWTAPVESARKTVKPSSMMMGTIFWDANGIVLSDYSEKRRTINGEYYLL